MERPKPKLRLALDGTKIRQARLNAGITEKELGRLTGYSRDDIGRLERGQGRTMRLERAEKMAAALKTPLENLTLDGQYKFLAWYKNISDFGAEVKRLRRMHGWTVDGVAEKMFLTAPYCWNVENNYHPSIRLERVIEFCRVLM